MDQKNNDAQRKPFPTKGLGMYMCSLNFKTPSFSQQRGDLLFALINESSFVFLKNKKSETIQVIKDSDFATRYFYIGICPIDIF